VALSLSDAFCVDRHRAAFRDLLQGVDVLFANEAEITSLYEVNSFEEAVVAARNDVEIAALTRSEQGSVIVRGDETIMISAEPTSVVDTTGAGDAYAAGFLAGLASKCSLSTCGRQGALAAAEIISHPGARPERSIARIIGTGV
jgi:fructokinase